MLYLTQLGGFYPPFSGCRCAIPSWLCLAGNAYLDLLGAPAAIGLSHAARGFDEGDELETNVANSGNTDDATSNVANGLVAKEKASDEDVDYQIRKWTVQ